MFLTAAEVVRLTGRVRFKAQRRILDGLGIRYIVAGTGEPLVREGTEITAAMQRPQRPSAIAPRHAEWLEWLIDRERAGPTGVIYAITEEGDSDPFKIGTCRSPGKSLDRRLCHLQIGNPRSLRVHRTWPGNHDMEQLAHRILGDARLIGEWFAYTDRTAAFLRCGAPSISECLRAALLWPAA